MTQMSLSETDIKKLLEGIAHVADQCDALCPVFRLVDKKNYSKKDLNSIDDFSRLVASASDDIIVEVGFEIGSLKPLKPLQGFQMAMVMKAGMAIPNSSLAGDNRTPLIAFTIADLAQTNISSAIANLGSLNRRNLPILGLVYKESDIFAALTSNLNRDR